MLLQALWHASVFCLITKRRAPVEGVWYPNILISKNCYSPTESPSWWIHIPISQFHQTQYSNIPILQIDIPISQYQWPISTHFQWYPNIPIWSTRALKDISMKWKPKSVHYQYRLHSDLCKQDSPQSVHYQYRLHSDLCKQDSPQMINGRTLSCSDFIQNHLISC